jgi:hypothetical protein
MAKCERCGAKPDGCGHDYCAECGRNLCPACMAAGCCGHKPALSGVTADHGDEEDEEAKEEDA